MNELIVEFEELIYEHKGISELILALSNVNDISLDDCTTGISILTKLSFKNNEALEKVWKEMHQLNKKSS